LPELPETETIARDLDAMVCGTTVVGVDVLKADVLRAALGLIVLLVGIQMGLELFVRPSDIFLIAPGIADG
jgi:hypothetical protein